MIVSVFGRPGMGYAVFAVIGLLHAFVLMMLIQTLGRDLRSPLQPRGHARTGGRTKIHAQAAAGYMVMQLVGAIAGAALCKLLLSELPIKRVLATPLSARSWAARPCSVRSVS